MTYIIETREEFSPFKERFKKEDCILLHLLADPKWHPAVNEIAILWCHFLSTGENFVIGANHNDILSIPKEDLVQLTSEAKVYTLYKKELLHQLPKLNVIDLQLLQYLETNSELSLDDTIPTTIKQYQTQFNAYSNANKALPLMRLIEMFQEQTKLCLDLLESNATGISSPALSFLNNIALPSLWLVEQSGLCVNPEGFLTHFRSNSRRLVKDGFVYSDYNLLTRTGRCSNRFGGINFAALPKEGGPRTVFVSRFGHSGEIVSIDYESFHLRLIADLIGFELPDEPVHEYLGKQYYNTTKLTPEQYEEGKAKTFQLLYGTYKSEETDSIPYFKLVEEYTQSKWLEIQTIGYVESPMYKRKIKLEHISDPTPSKIFNYIVQLYETERNLTTILAAMRTFGHLKSKIILYTYDAIVVDMHREEQDEISRLVEFLELEGKYPVRVYRGKNYQDLVLNPSKLRNT